MGSLGLLKQLEFTGLVTGEACTWILGNLYRNFDSTPFTIVRTPGTTQILINRRMDKLCNHMMECYIAMNMNELVINKSVRYCWGTKAIPKRLHSENTFCKIKSNYKHTVSHTFIYDRLNNMPNFTNLVLESRS